MAERRVISVWSNILWSSQVILPFIFFLTLENHLPTEKLKGFNFLYFLFSTYLSFPPEILLPSSKPVFFRMDLTLTRIITQLYSSEAVVLGNLENI